MSTLYLFIVNFRLHLSIRLSFNAYNK
ncbi:unnamed protein product [Acanthoscelides obtectus]|uniref:Uncharacterized protein n=1 Tax=Acanthoscelides obtectus TaxID=200917 RepID=A0A9P0JVM0_ACAOB|nr:unnamed protein product [Acanthoscelides obtectus]CAH1968810.1 unnamed protein product [Acanthoscelides obtectus]CAH2000874.1 unnamed protein product [Acanthoscelides obtectus]CAH2002698.1 unnamed protein product [Acanthoscelides obtectus]CAK1627644.1 hypothetical protein AOBTE_LOCUS4729 [Acanthoscelides obtectus]